MKSANPGNWVFVTVQDLLGLGEVELPLAFDHFQQVLGADKAGFPISLLLESLYGYLDDHPKERPRYARALSHLESALLGDQDSMDKLSYDHCAPKEISEDDLRKAMESGDKEAAFRLGLLLEEKQHLAEAERVYRYAMKLGVTEAAFNLGLLLKNGGRGREAIEAYRQALEMGDAEALFCLGAIFRKEGSLEEAAEVYHLGIQLGYGEAAFSLGVMFAEQGRLAEAEEIYRKGLELDDRVQPTT